MFRAINVHRPWPSTGMTSKKWLTLPQVEVEIKDLIASQDGIYFHGLVDTHEHLGLDPLPHVIRWLGDLYLEDGHHRVVKAALRGAQRVSARLLDLDA